MPIVGSQKKKEYIPSLSIIGFNGFPLWLNIPAPKKSIPIPKVITSKPIILYFDIFILYLLKAELYNKTSLKFHQAFLLQYLLM